MATPSDDTFHLWLEPKRSTKLYWQDVWRYRELFLILAWRDINIRYKQTIAGASWSLLQPLISMLIMSLIFGRVAGLPSEGNAPYPLMVFAALLPWQFFANSLQASSQSLVSNANLVSKVYFPRMIVPASSIVVALVDMCIAFVLLLGIMAWYQYIPSFHLLMLPLFLLVGAATSLGLGLITTSLNVKYRDFKVIIPFALQIGMYVSPVAYSSSLIREKFGEPMAWIYSLNPMSGVIDGFRWAILRGEPSIDWACFSISLVTSLLLLAMGIKHFKKLEDSFADHI